MGLFVNERNTIAGLAGAFGLAKTPTATYIPMTVEQKLKTREQLDRRPGPTPYISFNKNASFLGRGIQNVTKSVAYHAGLYVPEEQARRVRREHPEILVERRIPGSVEIPGRARFCEWIPPVPAAVTGAEIIEAKWKIELSEWDDVTREGEQLVFFMRDWKAQEAEAILLAAYYWYGSFYDIAEIGNFLTWLLPNSKCQFDCSSFQMKALVGRPPNSPRDLPAGDVLIEPSMIARRINPERTSPADMGRYFYSHPCYYPIAVQCDAEEVRGKV